MTVDYPEYLLQLSISGGAYYMLPADMLQHLRILTKAETTGALWPRLFLFCFLLLNVGKTALLPTKEVVLLVLRKSFWKREPGGEFFWFFFKCRL